MKGSIENVVQKLMDLFVHRRDVYAEQYVKVVNGEAQGAYRLVKQPITDELPNLTDWKSVLQWV
jgi:hypothetical protein